jgi:tRNA (cmo5U34)-methyltransferase
MRKALDTKDNISIISVDTSQDMLDRAKGYIENDTYKTPVIFKQADIRDIKIENASFIVLNFTLQFIPPKERYPLLQNIFNGMNKGACLIISEKVRFENIDIHETLTDIHHQFKREQGYSDLEIAQKRDAIENIMKVESTAVHLERLSNIGFKHPTQWYQNTAFCSFFANK